MHETCKEYNVTPAAMFFPKVTDPHLIWEISSQLLLRARAIAADIHAEQIEEMKERIKSQAT